MPVDGHAGQRVGRGDVGVGAEVDVEEGALRALEEDALALAALVGEDPPDRGGVGEDLGRDLGQLGAQCGAVDGGGAEAGAERVVVGEEAVEAGVEGRRVAEVGDADRAAADLVLVGRADAAAGGADLGGAGRLLAEAVKVLMQRQNQRRVLGDHQRFGADLDALAAELVDLGEERPGVEDDAVADDRELAGADDAGGEQRELVDGAVDDEGVAGVVAALEAGDDVGALGEPVDELALALVAPLRADHDDVGHASSPQPVPGRYIVPSAGPKPPSSCGGTRAVMLQCRNGAAGRGGITGSNTGPEPEVYGRFLDMEPVWNRYGNGRYDFDWGLNR